jgi:hypothetical protein
MLDELHQLGYDHRGRRGPAHLGVCHRAEADVDVIRRVRGDDRGTNAIAQIRSRAGVTKVMRYAFIME